MAKRGLLIGLVIVSLLALPVLAQPSDCKGTNLPSFKEYKIPNVARAWDSYSAQSEDVCTLDRRPETGECKFTFEVRRDVGPSVWLCWYGEGKSEVSPGDLPGLCKGTHLPSYKEYKLPSVKKLWDSYSAKSDGVCRFDRPAVPREGECKFTYDLFIPERGVQATLCWYDSTSEPIEVPLVKPVKQGFFSRIGSWFKNLFSPGELDFTKLDAQAMFVDQILSRASLPEGAVALMFPGELPAGTVVRDGSYSSVTMREPGYFMWLDPSPGMLYAHPTFYFFLFKDGQVRGYSGGSFALVDGENIRNVGENLFVSNGITGGVSAMPVSGLASGNEIYSDPLERHPAKLSPVGVLVDASASESVLEAECPPGYVKKFKEGDEFGYGFAVVESDPNLKLEGEADTFLSALEGAGWQTGGKAADVESFASAFKTALALPESSSFAMLISTHGIPVWDVSVRNKNTGDVRNIKGLPSIDPARNDLAVPEGWEVISSDYRGWALQLGGKNIVFSSDLLSDVKSCRKFLVASSCFSGELANHNVEGLSVYAATQKDRPALASKGSGLYSDAFTRTLLSSPPEDAERPWEDEPKPEFDNAHNAGASAVSNSRLQGRTMRIPLGRGVFVVWKFDQRAVSHSVPGKKHCQKTFECVPSDDWTPASPDESSCGALKLKVGRIPGVVEAMMGGGYPYDKLVVMAGLIRDLQSLKACYACPAGMAEQWSGCNPYGDALNIIDAFIEGLRAFAQNRFTSLNPDAAVGALEVMAEKFNSCRLECVSPVADVVTPGVLGNCRSLGLSNLFDDRIACKRYCTGECDKVPASAVATREEMTRANAPSDLRCWYCRQEVVDVSPGETEYFGVIKPTDDASGGSPEDWTFDCEQECVNRGMSTQRPDSSAIMQELQRHSCVSGASIKLKRTRIGESCVCYGEPQITVDKTPPVCRDTPCGNVPCGESVSCSEGTTTWTVSCNWGGWEQVGDFAYRPVISAAS